MPKDSVYVVGSLNHDLLIDVTKYPLLGETVLANGMALDVGGKGANQAVACAKLKARTFMVGQVGHDQAGDQLIASLRRNGVDTRALTRVPDVSTGKAIVMHTDTGENAIVVVPGANGTWKDLDSLDVLSDLTKGDIVVAQLEIPLSIIREALQIAREHGATTILNAAPAAPIDSLMSLVDVLVVNEVEAAVVAGIDGTAKDSAVRAAQQLAERFGTCVVLTLGLDGAAVIRQGNLQRLAPFTIDAVDSTGAGDAFVGALAAFLSMGYEIEQATSWANAAGAHACLGVGAQSASPTQEQLSAVFGVGPLAKASDSTDQ